MKLHPFSKIITDVTSKFRKIKTSKYKSEGRFRIIDQGQKKIAGFTDDESLINKTHSPIIIFGDHTRVLKYEESPIALGADGAKALAVNPKLANALYIYYYLRSINLKEAGYSRHFKFLKRVEIPIPEKGGKPNLDDQKRIAHLLGKVEGLIARRKQHLQQLDDLLKSVFLEMFGDPQQWELVPLESIAQKGRGTFTNGPFGSNLLTSELTDTGVPVIYIRDIRNAEYRRVSTVCVTREKAEELETCQVYPGDILIAKVGDPPGTSAIYPNDEPAGIITQDVIRIRPDLRKIDPAFVSGYLNSIYGIRIIREITVEATRARFSLRDFKAQEIPCPPIDLQNQFAAIVEKVEGVKSRYQQSLTDLESLYGALSQKAFKGELDLSRVPLPTEGPGITEKEKSDTEDKQPMEPLFELPEPADLAVSHSPEGRKTLIGEWLAAWLEQLGDKPFTAQPFMEAAWQRLWELAEDDAPDWGATEYDELKALVFEALEQGHLTQSYDEANNRIQIKAAKP